MFHKEGAKIILIATTLTVAILLLSDQFIAEYWIQKAVQILTLGFLILILQFCH
jgi:phosphatidylserine decarboxylase